eukprot:2817934-Alexandrium_andersonii.AAC.1
MDCCFVPGDCGRAARPRLASTLPAAPGTERASYRGDCFLRAYPVAMFIPTQALYAHADSA